MPDQILGLPTVGKFADAGFLRASHRRKVLHSYPQGGAPLTGILSMLKPEPVDAVTHYWYPKKWVPATTKLRGTAPFTSDAPSTGDADDGTNLTGTPVAITTAIYIKVDSTERFTPGHIVQLQKNGTQLRVDAVVRGAAASGAKGYLKAYLIRPINAATIADAADDVLEVIGSAHGEGATGNSVSPTGYRLPFTLMNQTYIARDSFRFSGSVLQQGLEFDKTGPYKEKAKDTYIDHMVDLEMNTIFGKRSTTERTALDGSGDTETVRTMSGILEFLELWDAGSTGITVDGSTYAPFDKFDAATVDTDDRKRIITNTSGNMGVDQFNIYAERVGRYHTNKTQEKLVLCGSGALNVFAKMFRRETEMTVSPNQSAYGLRFTTLHTPHGDFHFLKHPLFNLQPLYRNWALILDVHSMSYRPLRNRDTALKKNVQNNGDDFRKDEYLTEGLLECWFPENSMLIKNIQNYVAS
jgi:hypothetical protein